MYVRQASYETKFTFSLLPDDPAKNMPIVLLLYSYDCPAHEVVVTTFAYYLKEVANCEVILDIWDQHNLQVS